MENEQDPQEEPQEKNKGGRSNPIAQINQGYKHARRLQKSFSTEFLYRWTQKLLWHFRCTQRPKARANSSSENEGKNIRW